MFYAVGVGPGDPAWMTRQARGRRSEPEVDRTAEIYRGTGTVRAKRRVCPRSEQHRARAGRGLKRRHGKSRRCFDLRHGVRRA